MKKITISLLLLVFAVGTALIQPKSVYAQKPIPPTNTPTPVALPTEQVLGPDQISFQKLGFADETILRGPYDGFYYTFALPADWKMSSGGVLKLNYRANFSFKAASTQVLPASAWQNTYGGKITVALNGITVAELDVLGNGPQSITFSLPVAALTPDKTTGQNSLYIYFDAGETCYYNWTSSVTILPSSVFTIPHTIVPIDTNMIPFPRPIYQPNAFEKQYAVLVLPDTPSADELQAAMAVSSGLGKMTEDKLDISVTSRSKLTDDIRKSNHLIYIGKPSSLPDIGQLTLPAPVKNNTFDSPDVNEGDGVVQMVLSPWNPSRAVMVVSGSTDEGVMKAGQSVSTGTIRVGNKNNLAVVSDINNLPSLEDVAVDRTFLDLGYGNQTLMGQGIMSRNILFYVPSGKDISPDAYMEIGFSHSQVLDFNRSGLYVFLNNSPIATLRFSDKTAAYNRQKFIIPPYSLKPGMNNLRLETEFWPVFNCVDPDSDTLWAMVTADSLLHIPFNTEKSEAPQVINLGRYPLPYTSDPSLRGTMFILPPADPGAWDQAARLAYDLGFRNASPRYDPKVLVANGNLENEKNIALLSTMNVIMVGKPDIQLSLPSLNARMPAKYDKDTGKVVEQGSSILYRFNDSTSLGYLQLVQSIWNKTGSVLAISGNTDEGIKWAMDSLTTPTTLSKLSGNLAAIRLDQIVVGDVAGYENNTPASTPEALAPIPVSTQELVVGKSAQDTYKWMVPALIGTLVAIVIVLIILGIRAVVNRRSQ